ncbi:MAG TPA: phage portal protein [Actinomycetes bacterium]|jgi:HK97 family phage portal protein|nr:phage portal protein [Actinomycetes bacterium]
MGWWDRWVWSRVANREALTLEQLLADEARPTAAGEPVTVETALRLSTVWGCVRLLADSVSTLPLHVYRGEDRDPIPTPPLLARPSADFPDLADWLWAVMASLLLRGNAWGVVTARSGAGLLPAQVDLVHPDRVAVTTEQGRRVIRVAGVEYPRGELFHCKAFTWPGEVLGLSPIAYARETIGLGLAAEKYGGAYFGDAMVPSAVLESEQDIKKEAAEKLKAEYVALLTRRRRDIAVLGNGAKLRAIAIAPEESQFIQTQQFNVSAICRIFGVPPEAMGGQTAGHEAYTSPEMRSSDLLTWTLRPWLYRIERAVSTLLPRTQQARFNPGGMVRATLLDRYTAHKLGIEAGWLLPSEVRELEDRPPIPGIDDRAEPPEGVVA